MGRFLNPDNELFPEAVIHQENLSAIVVRVDSENLLQLICWQRIIVKVVIPMSFFPGSSCKKALSCLKN